jgi:hypothetical protein
MDSNQLEKYRHDLAFIRAAAEQTIRDCERFGFEVAFEESTQLNFEMLKLQLAVYLRKWCKEDSNHLSALLYHIDVPEHLLPKGRGCSDPDRLSELILQRELIKVVMRKLYST